MKYVIDQQNLVHLYSSSPKIIISRQDRELAGNTLNLQSLKEQITVYELQKNGDFNNLVLLESPNSESELVALKLAPNFCLGLVCFSERGKQELQELWNWWQTNGNALSIPNIFVFDSEQTQGEVQAEFWRQIYSVTAQENQNLARRIATLQKQYLGLRTLHENMQNAFATVEDYLSQAKLPELQLAFAAQPSEKSLNPSKINESNSLSIYQLLPVSSRGIASIELHIAQSNPHAVGQLKIGLKACEDTTAIAFWQVPYSHLTEGWLSLDLPSIDLGRKRDVEITVEWQTELGPAPAMSLTKLQSIPEAKVKTPDKTIERSLAIKIWQGLPGTRKVTSPYLLINSNNAETVHDIPLGALAQGIMAQVKEVTPNLASDDFAYIQIFGHGEKILTHPRADGSPTIAMLGFCFPPGADQLKATVAVEHEQAGVVAYAMAIIDPETDPQNCLEDSVALAFSGWVEVSPQIPQQIFIELASKVKQHCHIVIAAKLAEEAVPDFAWAYWLNFELSAASSKASPYQEKLQPVIPNNTLIRDVSESMTNSEFVKVQLIENDTKIQVHPTLVADTIAVISNFIALGTTKIRAIVCTENEEADKIEYAMAAIVEDEDNVARKAIASPSSALSFTGWQSLPASQAGQLELDLVVPTVADYHLVLATRIPEGGSQSNAWARWLSFEYYP